MHRSFLGGERLALNPEADAELYEGQANECRWNAAELIAAELKSGKSQRQLAEEIGKSQKHVFRANTLWKRHGDSYTNHSLTETYSAELKSGKSQRQLADEIGKSQKHVCFAAKAWNVFGEYLGTPSRTP